MDRRMDVVDYNIYPLRFFQKKVGIIMSAPHFEETLECYDMNSKCNGNAFISLCTNALGLFHLCGRTDQNFIF